MYAIFILSEVLNIIAALLLGWWSFGVINNILLLIPSVLFFVVGCLCIAKATKKSNVIGVIESSDKKQ